MTDLRADPHDEPTTETSGDPAAPAADAASVRPYRDLPPVTERELAARARGLASAYIEGGDDPDPELTRRKEAKYRRLLIGMIVLIVGSGFVFTILDIASTGLGK
jgi:hypothetical protein